MAHPYPRVLDNVYVLSRDERDENPYGYIARINYDTQEAVVKFFNMPKIRHAAIAYFMTPQWFKGSQFDSISLDHFHGCWSSHEGGEGEWQLI